MAVSRKHYYALAACIKDSLCDQPETRAKVARSVAAWLREDNRRFDTNRFIKEACGDTPTNPKEPTK